MITPIVATDTSQFDMASDKFCEALAYSARMHRTQRRRSGNTPYLGHLLQVAGLVAEFGGNEDEVIAALLHDGPEDQGGLPRLAEIQERFGDQVAKIVGECSDTFETPKPAWGQRKARYVEFLRSSASESALRVKIADYIHNWGNSSNDLLELGTRKMDLQKHWAPFGADMEASLANCVAIEQAILERVATLRESPGIRDEATFTLGLVKLHSTLNELQSRARADISMQMEINDVMGMWQKYITQTSNIGLLRR